MTDAPLATEGGWLAPTGGIELKFHPGYYSASVIDPDGNNIEAVHHGLELPVSAAAADYQPGDLVTWRLRSNLPHIGLITDLRSEDGERYLVVHNIGPGPEVEDALFDHEITSHFRFRPSGERGR